MNGERSQKPRGVWPSPDSAANDPSARAADAAPARGGADAASAYGGLLPSLPRGGGALRGIGEKFAMNPVIGTGTMSIPIATSSGRAGFGPALALSYDSGAGNGPFGMGWTLPLPAITRKTDKGLPRYRDAEASDVFLLSGTEDLVPVRNGDGALFQEERDGHRIHRFAPRIEGGFSRIERWTEIATGDVHWRTISASNVTAIYGQSDESRVVDPDDSSRVFSWLVCETWDDKGHAVVYEYARETSDGVDRAAIQERNRTDAGRRAQRYIKRIKYGNRVSRLVQPDLAAATWLFEVVFDYDEDHVEPLPPAGGDPIVRASITPGRAWALRPDPFSRYRAAFELRTYRRCARVLMFHRFEELGAEPYLVRSTELDYADLDLTGHPVDVAAELSHKGSTRFASFLRSATHAGYIQTDAAPVARGGAICLTYAAKRLPPVEFDYSQAIIEQAVDEVGGDSLDNLPVGLDGIDYRWVDLDGEGLTGVLTEQGGAWFYKRNLSPLPLNGGAAPVDGPPPPARFGPLEHVQVMPFPANLTRGTQQLLDLSGDGQLDVVELETRTPGFFERTTDGGWRPFRAFDSLPNVEWSDPNLRFIDLTGDGSPDLLITEDDVFTWYESLAEQGFGGAERARHALDEEKGPRVVFADGTQSIHLADLSGDGLTDLVRVRNGEVCYWPNLGYGRFGAKVTMDNAPWLDAPDQFDQSRVRLADIDGSGVADIVYLGRDGVDLYFNQAGNRWSDPHRLAAFPRVDDVSSVAVVDLLGNGTACLVWSSPLANDAPRPMRYLRLMAEKPHLLTHIVNNMGGDVRVRYAPSTRFYAQDRAAGRPWVTRLPFPVHVVEQVETVDHISRTRFTSRYAYHHGHFDGVEGEFRGFGMVEQWDTEAYEDYVIGVARIEGGQEQAPDFYQPPILTRSWFHTGAYFDGEKILHRLRDEYYLGQQHLRDAALPDDIDADELRQCVRALKGSLLRREVYDLDGTTPGPVPYLVTESNYDVRLVQRRGAGRHAVFHTVGRETVSFNYERDAADPRVGHGINLEIGPYGNVLESASIIYGRKVADPTLPPEVRAAQARQYITYVEADHTGDIDQAAPRAYRLRVPYASRSYEITGIAPAGALFTADEIAGLIAGAAAIDYEVVASGLGAQKRLLAHSRVLFLDDDLSPLPLGQWDTLGLTYRGFQLAFSPGVIDAYYAGQVSDAELTDAGYVQFDGDPIWWIPSGTPIYPADPGQHFYIPIGSRDPLGLEATATFDPYDLLVERTRVTQAPWSEQIATNDYRVLGPVMMTDPNQNRSAVEIDALGLVVRSAVMGKVGSSDGDTLADPTARMEYDVFNWKDRGKPNYVRTFTRELHGPSNVRWQESYVYSNATGGVAMSKTRVHPGKALAVAADGSVSEVNADPRWVGNGRTIVNNKGNAVKQYEPYFSATHEYEDESALRELGATPLNFYDALGRNVRTLYPNGTLARVAFTPWMQEVFDANDTVKESRWYADRGSPDPAVEPEPLADRERRAAWLAASHAATPAVVHLDSLGRVCYAVADYGGGNVGAARTEADLGGRNTRLYDQEGREVSRTFIAMSGAALFGDRAEKGRCWTFQDVTGALVKTWDEHGRRMRTEYDALHRPVSSFVVDGGGGEVLFHHVVYGDRHPDAVARNLLGATHLVFDQAGQVRVPALNFKGNAPLAERVLCTDYQQTIDWSAVASQVDYADIQPAADAALDAGEVFQTRGSYDALNRPTEVTLPDGTVIEPTYNAGGVLTRLRAQIRGQGAFIDFLEDQDYDARGQRLFAEYGNDLVTRYFYDPQSFRLTQLLTYPSGGDPATQALQDLKYTFDPVGNVTDVVDDAQQTHYFNNAVVKPESRFTYDAVYHLVRATGREHAGIPEHHEAEAILPLPHPNDLQAVRTYTEEYEYDLLGNIKLLRHTYRNQAGARSGWTRRYHYAYEDDPQDRTNRLVSTSAPGDPDAGPYSATYDHDAYGNMTRMPHLPELRWGFLDQLRRVDLGGGGVAYYVYATGGQRMRKVIERDAGTLLEWISLGAVSIFRRRRRLDNQVELERWTVHIGDNTGTIAQVDTKTIDTEGSDPGNPLDTPLIRYQYGDHLSSGSIETDAAGNVISYEEYHPYGTTAYRSSRPGFNLSLKRFRYCGKERDDESGLYYFGARYYAPWLGRWTSSDPAGFVGGFNLYRYCANNPVMFRDPSGTQEARWRTDWRSLGENDPVTNTRIDTLEEFQRWAVRHNIQYEGTPRLEGGTWRVTQWREVGAGEGGPAGGAGGSGGSTPGAGATTAVGQGVVTRHPEGHIHELHPSMDEASVRAYNERVQERAVAIRSRDPGSRSRTRGLRRANQQQVNDFVAQLPGGQRPPGAHVDHTVQLQDISRRSSVVRPQDHRLQPGGANSSQGASQAAVNRRNLASGVPEDVPAGAVARSGPEMLNPRIQPGYRAAMRYGGYGLTALGPALTFWGASQVENQAVRYTGYGLATGEGIGAATYFTGRVLMGGGASGAQGPLSVMRAGGAITRVAGGAAGIALGGYGLYTDISTGNYGTTPGDVASIVGGGAVLAGSAPVAAIAAGVGLANTAGDFVERQVTPEYGRTAGVAAGTAAGAAVGAAAGAAIGVIFFGVGAAPGAAIGAAVGAVVGFIGAFW